MAAVLEPIRLKSPNAPLPGRVPMGTRKLTLCSVYFNSPDEKRINNAAMQENGEYRGLCVYNLPAAPRDGYVLMDIYSGPQFVRSWTKEDAADPDMDMKIVQPEEIVQDLMQAWSYAALSATERARPGIGVIAGDTPTEQELAYLRGVQEAWCQIRVDIASSNAIQGKFSEITDVDRGCARWLLGNAADQFVWMNKKVLLDVKNCVACGKQIMAVATRCEHCTVELPKFYLEYGMDSTVDPAVDKLVQLLKAKRQVVTK